MALLFIRILLIAIALGVLFILARQVLSPYLSRLKRREGPSDGSRGSKSGSRDAYEVLGVSPRATGEEVRTAYHEALSKYHPDKVAHLGEDLRRLAEQKTAEIIEAYKTVMSHRSR